jgi:hypothetical protein
LVHRIRCAYHPLSYREEETMRAGMITMVAVAFVSCAGPRYMTPTLAPNVGVPFDGSRLPAGNGWTCWRGTAGGTFIMGECSRNPAECATSRDEAIRQRKGQDMGECTPLPAAFCYTYKANAPEGAVDAFRCLPDQPLCESLRCSREFEKDCSLCASVP